MSQTARYANVMVKVGSERSALLSEDKLKMLTEHRNLKEFVSDLREIALQEKIDKLQPPITSRKLEKLFREDQVESYCKMVQSVPDTVFQFLKIYIQKFEYENLKTILKAVNVGLTNEETLNRILLPAEDFLGNHDLFERITAAIDVKAVVGMMQETVYTEVLNAALRRYEETKSLQFFDVLLDKMYYENFTEAFKKLPTKEQKTAFLYASLDADGFALLAILRGKALNHDPHWIRLAIPRVHLNITGITVEAIITAEDFEHALGIVVESSYGRYFTKAETPETAIANAEQALKKARFEHARKSRIKDTFSIGTPLGFMVQKEAETYNLIAISLGIEYGWSSEHILQTLLL